MARPDNYFYALNVEHIGQITENHGLNKTRSAGAVGSKATSGKNTKYRDEKGARKLYYKRFKEGRDYEKPSLELQKQLIKDLRDGYFGYTTTPTGEEVQKHPGGRPPKYETIESFNNIISEYFQHLDDAIEKGIDLIPDVEGFCSFAGLSRGMLYDWRKSRSPEFSEAINNLMTGMAAYKKQLGFQGKIPPVVLAIDLNNNHGYVQQQKIEINAQDRLQELPDRSEILKKLPKTDEGDTVDVVRITPAQENGEK